MHLKKGHSIIAWGILLILSCTPRASLLSPTTRVFSHRCPEKFQVLQETRKGDILL